MDAEDWVSLGLLGNEIAWQWAHPTQPMPAPAATAVVNVPGARLSFNPNLLILVAGIVAVVVLTK